MPNNVELGLRYERTETLSRCSLATGVTLFVPAQVAAPGVAGRKPGAPEAAGAAAEQHQPAVFGLLEDVRIYLSDTLAHLALVRSAAQANVKPLCFTER